MVNCKIFFLKYSRFKVVWNSVQTFDAYDENAFLATSVLVDGVLNGNLFDDLVLEPLLW